MDYQQVLRFWFEETGAKFWFKKDPDFDEEIYQRFGSIHFAATQGLLSNWRDTDTGRLAEIIVLDQFSRNIYRDQVQAFAFDPIALVLAQEAIRNGADQRLAREQAGFIYMPFMHSESLLIHQTAIQLFSQPGYENQLTYEKKHQEIIQRFGRYPHRNEVLGRESTADEIEFLKGPGSSF